ncbi:LPXTG cell wall anchor domain-containing protein [Nocardiopsis sp. Huas11]|uniref:LPXTG cell wall anchor domain-containing protein n=1 Tax=Nocardiopsis sp. Huas11 TaxID=2183912 RepID=UPI0011C4A274|nr:LPXTG cell wall anchor domain-containing protein [Nocardiopsis sp. Huas11]
MKISPRFSARRIAQGGATFAAFGALTLAAAMPAAADTTYGWGFATASGGEATAATDVTQSGSASGTTGGLIQVDDCFSLDAETTATVGANGVTATTVINSARIELTQECLNELPEDELPVPDEDDENEDDETVDPDESDEPADDESVDPDESDETEDPDADADETEEPVETEDPDADADADETEEPVETPEPTESDAAAESTEVVTLDEENSTTVSASGEPIVDISVTGASVTTTQSWDGVVDHSVNQGSATGDAQVFGDHYVDTSEEDGVTWNDGVTDLYVTFAADEFQVTYYLGTTAAAVATVADGGNGGGNGGDDGDEQNPPARDGDQDEEPAPKAAQPLPQTGSPIVGLIGAGAAIAAGGAAAAFLARRKKTAATAEENGEG